MIPPVYAIAWLPRRRRDNRPPLRPIIAWYAGGTTNRKWTDRPEGAKWFTSEAIVAAVYAEECGRPDLFAVLGVPRWVRQDMRESMPC